jgi:hypothetical protein
MTSSKRFLKTVLNRHFRVSQNSEVHYWLCIRFRFRFKPGMAILESVLMPYLSPLNAALRTVAHK